MTTDNPEDAGRPPADDVEGLDNEEAGGVGGYPIDSLMIRTDRRTVFEVCRRIEKNVYVLDPEFQREFIWDEVKQSRLIESAMMRIPLPVFYLAETPDGKIVVVDGLQRLSTFKRFLSDDLRLKGLEYAADLNGKRFKDLPMSVKNRVEDTNLTLYLIDSKVPDQAKLDIFERVNSGEPLTKQQMRNCLYLGEATRWLARMAKQEEFLSATAHGLNHKTMRDRECINRFLAFTEPGDSPYTGNMDNFLRDVLRRLRNADQKYWEGITERFVGSMRLNAAIFGQNAFRKVKTGEKPRRSVINVAMFDVFSVLLARPQAARLTKRPHGVREGLNALLEDPEFVDAITLSTNSVRKVSLRFKRVEKMLAEVAT
ncbi:MAG: DUF262 domain-containing protein [Kiritimatiellia bacterium]